MPDTTRTNNPGITPVERPETVETHFGLLSMLFSFRGRLSLAMFWILGLAINFVFFSTETIFLSLMESESPLVAATAMAMAVLFVWVYFAMVSKRLHDIGWPGWLAILTLLPAVGQVFALLAVGCSPGTRGPNRYGVDPRSTWFPGFIDPPRR